jgi:hypothetical protein
LQARLGDIAVKGSRAGIEYCFAELASHVTNEVGSLSVAEGKN